MNAQELMQFGIDQYHAGELASSAQYLEEAIITARKEMNIDTELLARSNICEAYIRMGSSSKAIEVATALLARAKQVGSDEYEVRGIGRLAMAVQLFDLRGRWGELKPLLTDGVEKANKLGLTYWEIQNLETLGSCAVKMGLLDEGFQWLQRALTAIHPGVFEEDYFRSRIYQSLSSLMRLRGNAEEAVRYAEVALGIATSNKNNTPNLVASAKLSLAESLYLGGERAEALEYVHDALYSSRREKWIVQEQFAEYIHSRLEFDLGHLDVAEQAARQALVLAGEIKMKEEEVICLMELGKILLNKGGKSEAIEILNKARIFSVERGYDNHKYNAERLLELLG